MKKQTVNKKEINFTFALDGISKFREIHEVKGNVFTICNIPFSLFFSNYRSFNKNLGSKIDVELRCHLNLKAESRFNVRGEYRLMSLLPTIGRISKQDFLFTSVKERPKISTNFDEELNRFKEQIELDELTRPEYAYIAYDTDSVLINFSFIVYNLRNLDLNEIQ